MSLFLFLFLTFFALIFGDVASALEVVEGKDILKLGLVVDDGPAALLLALLQQVDQERLDVLGLLIAENRRQVLYTYTLSRYSIGKVGKKRV